MGASESALRPRLQHGIHTSCGPARDRDGVGSRHAKGMIMIARSRRWAVAAALIVLLCSARAYAAPLLFGVVGSPIDISANVRETILPATAPVFQDSKPLFGTTPDPKETSEL